MHVVEVREIPLSSLDPPARPRRSVMNEAKLRELAESLAMVGQKQAIQVIRRGERFEVVIGHRRLIAAGRISKATLRSEVVEGTDRDIFLSRVHENSKRDDLSPLERATEARECLEAAAGNIEAAALMLGVSVSTVDAWLDVLTWPRDVQEAVDRGDLGRSAGRWLAKIADDRERELAVSTATRDGCTEALARWYFQQWSVRGALPMADGQTGHRAAGGLVLADPTWPCYLCLEQLSFATLYTVRVCAHCAPVIAANREDGKSQDPNLGLLG